MKTILSKLDSQPSYELRSQNKKLNDFLHNRILNLSIKDNLDTYIDELMISFDNRSFKENLFIPSPNFGKDINVKLGYPPSLMNLGNFYIDSWNVSTPPSQLNITAKSINLLQGYFDQQTEIWKKNHEKEKKSIADILEKIAKKYNLETQMSEQYKNETIQEYQYVESDIHFLSRLAKQYNAYFKIKQNKLFFKEYDSLQSDKNTINTVLLTSNNLISCQVETQEGDNYHAVQAVWYDYDSASYRIETYPKTEASKQTADNLKSVGSKKIFTLREKFPLQTAAQYAAKAKYRLLSRNKQMINIKAIGNVNLATGKILQLNGLQKEINGKWILKHINHNFEANGFTTSINAYRYI